MGDRLILSDNRDDPGNPLVLDGEAIDAAARDPLAIGKLMVDQVWAEGTDWHGARFQSRLGEDPWHPPGRAAGGVPGHPLALRMSAVGLSPPSSRSSGPGSRRSPAGCWSRA